VLVEEGVYSLICWTDHRSSASLFGKMVGIICQGPRILTATQKITITQSIDQMLLECHAVYKNTENGFKFSF